jgi:hypothetical protein
MGRLHLLLCFLAAFLLACPPVSRQDDDDATTSDDDDSGDDDDITSDDDDSTEPPPECVDDAFEENDTVLEARALQPGSYNNLSVCPFDPDWYEVLVPAGYRLTVQAVFLHDSGDLDLVLQDDEGTLVDSSFSQSDNELVGPESVTQDTAFFVEVRLVGFGGDPPGNTYGIAFLVEPTQ